MKIFFFIFSAIMLAGIASAASPFIGTTSTKPDITIEHPITDVIAANLSHKFHFHLFWTNTSYPIINTTAIQCIFHLYDPFGNHILKNNLVGSDDRFDWEQIVAAGNFTILGQYSYVFQCNNSIVGGFYEHDFLVTPTGHSSEQENIYNLDIALYALFIIAFIFFIGFIFIPDLILKWASFGLFFLFLVIGINLIGISMHNSFGSSNITGFYDGFGSAMYLSLWFVFGILLIMLIYKIIFEANFSRMQKDAERFGSSNNLEKYINRRSRE